MLQSKKILYIAFCLLIFTSQNVLAQYVHPSDQHVFDFKTAEGIWSSDMSTCLIRLYKGNTVPRFLSVPSPSSYLQTKIRTGGFDVYWGPTPTEEGLASPIHVGYQDNGVVLKKSSFRANVGEMYEISVSANNKNLIYEFMNFYNKRSFNNKITRDIKSHRIIEIKILSENRIYISKEFPSEGKASCEFSRVGEIR